MSALPLSVLCNPALMSCPFFVQVGVDKQRILLYTYKAEKLQPPFGNRKRATKAEIIYKTEYEYRGVAQFGLLCFGH